MGTVRMLAAAGLAACVFSGVASPPPSEVTLAQLRERLGRVFAEVRTRLVFPLEGRVADPELPGESLRLAAATRRLGTYHPVRGLALQAAAYLAIDDTDSPEVDRMAREAHSRVLRALWMLSPHEALAYPIHLARRGRPEAALEVLRREVEPVLRVEYGPSHPVWLRVRYEEARFLALQGDLEEAAGVLAPLIEEHASPTLAGTGLGLSLRLGRALALRLGREELAARLGERSARLESKYPPTWRAQFEEFERTCTRGGPR
jgi:hypothetical protein